MRLVTAAPAPASTRQPSARRGETQRFQPPEPQEAEDYADHRDPDDDQGQELGEDEEYAPERFEEAPDGEGWDNEPEPTAEDEEEPAEEPVAQEPEDDADDGRPRLLDLGREIRREHRRFLGSQAKGVRHALQAGKLLLQAKRRVPHGEWQRWIEVQVCFSERQAQKYMRLYRHQHELDALQPDWRKTLPFNEALELLTQHRPESEVEHDAEEPPDPDLADDEDGEGEGAGGEEESAPDPAEAMKLFRKAKAAHRQRVERLAEFLQGDHLTFEPGSPEQNALDELRGKLVRAARAVARKVHERQFDEEGFDVEATAMVLVTRLIEQADVAAMFGPARPAARHAA